MPLLLALIAILLVGGGAYMYTQNKQGNQSVTVSTSDWKTYANTQYGFEIKYPSNLSVKITAPIMTSTVDRSADPIDLLDTISIYDPSEKLPENPIGADYRALTNVSFQIYNKSDKRIADDSEILNNEINVSKSHEYKGYEPFGKYIIPIGNFNIDAYKVSSGLVGSYFSSLFTHDKYFFRVSSYQIELAKQILSTLKFSSLTAQTSSPQTFDWKTYTISSCGVKVIVKTNQTFTTENVKTGRSTGDNILFRGTGLDIWCQAKNKNPQTDTELFLNNVSNVLSVQSDGTTGVNKNDYRVFDDQTISSITKLYSARNVGYKEGSEAIGFETQNWIYTFTFLNPAQAKNQGSFLISVVNPATN